MYWKSIFNVLFSLLAFSIRPPFSASVSFVLYEISVEFLCNKWYFATTHCVFCRIFFSPSLFRVDTHSMPIYTPRPKQKDFVGLLEKHETTIRSRHIFLDYFMRFWIGQSNMKQGNAFHFNRSASTFCQGIKVLEVESKQAKNHYTNITLAQ